MSDWLTLREAFDKYLAPDVRTLSAATKDSYRWMLRDWETITDNPPVGAIDDATLANYRDTLAATHLADATVNKRLRSLFAVLNRLAPALPGNRRGVGVINRVPYCRFLKVEPRFPRVASADELNRLYHACDAATWPDASNVPPPDWWRAWIVLMFNTGPRRRDLEGLKTSDVSFEGRTLRYAARKTGKLQVVPLNTVSLAHLQSIWSDRDFVFRWTPSMVSGLFEQWKAIKNVAGISERLTFHDLRRTCGTAFANVAGVEVASVILGHAVRGVTATFYVDPRERIRTAAEELNQPEAFLSILDRRPELRRTAQTAPHRRADWSFRPGEARYRGHVIPQLGQKRIAVLQILVSAGRPLPCDAIASAVWHGRAVNPVNVKATIASLREILKTALQLPPDWNPLPNDQTGAGWSLVLPVTEDE